MSRADRSGEIVERFERAQDRLVLQASDLSLQAVSDMAASEAIDIAPLFQRRERWNATKQSALIESFILNIPVPPVYLAETEFGRFAVIDGKQRITAIRDFMLNQLKLTKLERFPELEGLSFERLPLPLRNALQVRPYIRAVALLRQSDPDVKYEVFHRLNTGGEPLNAQEIRNVVFRGPLNDLIYELAGNSFLRQQLKIANERAPAYRKMQDAEYVLRFLTLLQIWEEFSGDLRASLDDFMKGNQSAPASQLREFKASFTDAIARCEALWGKNAFHRYEVGGWRDQALAGMYDAQMIAAALIPRDQVGRASKERKVIDESTRLLFRDAEFDSAVRVGTNTPRSVRHRIEAMRQLIFAAVAD